VDDLRSETVTAIDAVERGLSIALGGVGRTAITSKGPRDLVTETDLAVEVAIRAALGESSGLPVVGEEQGGDVPNGSAHWLVDPICGTRNFAFAIPFYSVNLALVEDERVTIAASGDASTGAVLVAERGGGAWALKDGVRRRLEATDASEAVVVETGRASGARRAHAARFAAATIASDRWDVLALGSSLSLGLVATGRVAAYVLFDGSALHVGAGSLLAAEAGATVSDLRGDAWTVRSDSIVATADAGLHEELIRLVAETLPGDAGG
jgi:myo-inositol-1(or 4)-monophosphatase